MKKQLLQKQRGILLALFGFLCVISIKAQTLLYSNDFESGDGLNGSTIVGNGVMEASGDAAHGQVFHNNPDNTNAVRTKYLKLPETIFSDFQATGSQGLTVSFWVNKSNATDYFYSPMFGAYGTAPIVDNNWGNKPAFTLEARSVGLVNFDYTNTIDNQNYGWNEFFSGASTSWLDAGGWHFYTFTITPTTGIVYVDGVVKNQYTFDGSSTSGVDGLFHVASELKYVALGGCQAYGWGDRDPAFAYDKLKIYAEALTSYQINSLMADGVPIISLSKSSLVISDAIATTETFDVLGMNLTADVTLTAPTGITLSGTNLMPNEGGTYTIAVANANATNTITATWDGSANLIVNISVASTGVTNQNISVKTSKDIECFTPLYPTGNMIADPYCNYYLTDGWGTKSINTNPTYVYCGSSSGHITNGSIDRKLNGQNGNTQWAGNTLYRVKAMVYGISGNVGIGVFNWGGTGDIGHTISANGAWETIDFTFTTGATPGDGGIFFNNGEGYIDNWEMYAVSADQVATQADKDALYARITTATNLLSSTTEGNAYGQYTTANRTTLQNLINSSTTLYDNSSALMVAVTNASLALVSAMLTYQHSMIATQAEKDALNARITTATSLLSSTPEGDALGKYTTANRTILQNLITSSTTLYDNSIATETDVNSATSSLAAAITTYQNSMNKVTNQLADGDYYIKIGGMYVNDPGSSIADGTSPKISNNGLQSQINIADNSQIYTIAKVSGSNRILAIDRYSFFNKATSRNLNESALYKDLWGGTGDDPWRTQNIYYNGTNYAIQAAGNSAYVGMWYLKTGNELTADGINRTPIAADYVFTLVPVDANLTTSGDANLSSIANWSLGRIPISGDYVTVLNGHTLTIDQDVTVNGLTIDPSAKVTLSPGSTLTVTGNFAINSDATGTGTYIDNGTTVATNVDVQQYLTGSANSRCWYLTTPVVGSTSNAFMPATNRLWSYSEAGNSLETVYTPMAAGVSLTPGTGYVARMAASGNISLSGTSLFNEDKTFTLSCVSTSTKIGFNLIGNPYPCYLDIKTAFDGAIGFEPSAWYSSSTDNISNVFDTFNAYTGFGTAINSVVDQSSLAIIPPMQAFWVRATNDASSLTFSKLKRSHKLDTGGNNLRSATTSDVKQIRLNVSNGTNTDQTLIGFYAQAMDEFDNCDSRKMFNGVANLPEIYTLAGSTIVAINGLPLLTDTREIALGFKTAQAGSFTIKAAEILNLEADQTVILKDKQLNVSQNLTDQPVYSFSSDAVTTTSRFSIVIGKMATALKLAQKTSFDVRTLNNGQMEIALDGATQASVKVYDTVGKQVFAQDILSQTSSLSKTFSKGVYLVKVSIGGVENTKKVVINL